MPKPSKKRAASGIRHSFKTAIQSKDVNKVRELIAAGHEPNGNAARLAVDLCIEASQKVHRMEKYGQKPLGKEHERAAGDAEAYYKIAEALIDAGAAAPVLLYSAAHCGHTKLVQLLIRGGADVDGEVMAGTPLGIAVSAGNVEVVRVLIKAGADIHQQGVMGTLLKRAIDENDVEVAKLLIAEGVDVNVVPRFGASAFLTAVTQRKTEFVRLLLDSGADVNQKGSVVCGEFGKPEVKVEGMFRTTHVPNPPLAEDATPLIVAARRGYAELAAQLIAAGADVQAGDAKGFTALFYALKANDEPMIRLLRDAGAKPPIYAEGSLVASWIIAAKAGDCARLQELADDGADVNVSYDSDDEDDEDDEDDGEGTALKYATRAGHLDAVKLLLALGAKVDVKHGRGFDALGDTALMHAAKAGHGDIAHALITAGATVTARDGRGKTVLHYGAEGGHAGIIELLVRHGANIETKSKDGISPLMEAANSGHAGAITALLKAGADPNRFTNGFTALWYAASSGNVAAVQALLDGGANPKLTAMSPLEAASSSGYKEVVNLLLKHAKSIKKGVDIKKPAETDGAALASAALMGRIEIVRSLLESGADPNSVDEEHFTALMGAVRSGRIELVQMLLKAGADVNALNEDRETALDLAFENIKIAKDRAPFVAKMKMKGRDLNPDMKKLIRAMEPAGTEDEITKILREAGAKKASEMPDKQAPRPAEPESAGKEFVEVEIPDFRERAKKPEFQKAIAELASLTGKRAKTVRDDEGEPLAGCVSFQVPTEMADKILKEHHEKFLKRGSYLFKSDRGYTSGKDTLTLFPTTSRAEVLAAYQTNGANCDVYTADVIRWLDELEKTQPFLLTGAGFDWCEGSFTKPLVDSKKLAKRMYEFCPDIVDQGVGDVSRLALELKKKQQFFFWWD